MGGSSTSAKKASSLFYAELVEVRVGAEKLSGGKKIQFLLMQVASRSGRADGFYTTAFYNPLLSFRRNLNSQKGNNEKNPSRVTRDGACYFNAN